MISIAMFNNKGGVGKTTLTCNIASFFAIEYKYDVVVIDCDPQCNATQLIMGQDYTTDFYWYGRIGQDITTIKHILQPLADGDSIISNEVKPVNYDANRFGVDLIPGHPSFSIIEDRLGTAWNELKSGTPAGIRQTNWNTQLCEALDDIYDLAFFDLGPSLGSINRSVLVGCDRFITPMAADIFSILGVRNIKEWIDRWMEEYEDGLSRWRKSDRAGMSKYTLKNPLDIDRGYVGYTMQQYITKTVSKGKKRPIKAYEDIIQDVPKIIDETLGDFLPDHIDINRANIGDIPQLYSLIPLAQSSSVPVYRLSSKDGLVGSQFKQRDTFAETIELIVDRLSENLNLEDD
ncbi:CobQ/CobB/MinD/ParA nucleotide binding domain-containing protein [Desulfatibacillum alkenivorans DSM 16219]|jgi:cellulose biosynthesis protein BcsQ|uniref:CobQ/CobB/MinD/ParA nucleotide binding domain-containing protein n=1 Tax=Desulfatibacillum alkenivorans DSM 16219 TaxID=1121393 RepID=A0A1M6ZYG5_9BACT|nr:ParA family protein [Desulfatibacillum alkenivorans]SHL35456.1 CobQ/CobB/MinD/ParA nucleotide binding domain-containing protein [Desulfatibacillum alkenivorans DSM 16219]